MSAIDELASSLLEEAKRFLEKAQTAEKTADDPATQAFLHASLMLAFCSLEAHTNAIADEFADRPELSVHERTLLQEKDVRMEAGVFAAQGFRMTRLEDRYLFLHQRFGGTELDRIVGWWAELSSAAELRNRLTHPKVVPQITVNAVQRAIQAIIDAIDSLFRAIYRKPFPARIRGLQSRLGF
jgi:hypothetical protein